jgi:hypothetical protein
MSEHIKNLRTAIETMHKCKAMHKQSVWVAHGFGNKSVWEGVVESFDLTDHTTANRCYAWCSHDNGEAKYVILLGIPPVVSPQTAVRAAISL